MASFGEHLRQERELRGIDLRDVADTTKISLRFLDALENDRVELLPGGLFPRAFVRQYAAYLGLDPERMVSEFLFAHGHEMAAPEKLPVARPAEPASHRGLLSLLLALALVGGLAAWRQVHTTERAGDVAPVATSVPPATFPAEPVYPPPSAVPAPTPAVEADGLVLALSARSNCWVAATADGVRILDRVLAEGEKQTLNAKDEIVLSVGNAGGIAFELNGRPGVPLGKDGEVRRNIVITRQNLPSLVQETTSPATGG